MCYKAYIFLDDGYAFCGNTYIWVIATNKVEGINRILQHYNSQYDTVVQILSIEEDYSSDLIFYEKARL